MQNKFLFAGSFNPYTIGHHSVYENATEILSHSQVIVGVIQNPNKTEINPQLLKWRMNPAFHGFMSTNVKVVPNQMLADYANNIDATLIRSLRNSVDLVQETDLATWNKEYGVDTIFIPSDKELDHVSSSAIREIHSLGKNMNKYFVNETQYKRYVGYKPKRMIVVGRMGSGKSSFIDDTFEYTPSFDLDKLVAERVKPATRQTFQKFFNETPLGDISAAWDHSYMTPYKDEVVGIIDEIFETHKDKFPVFEVSAFTSYKELEKYYASSVIIYVDNYDNGKARTMDLDFMVKCQQLQTIPSTVDFVINKKNGKLDDVIRDITKLTGCS